jgi:myo-inositol-1(or 4)-monophosphatase
MERQVIEKARRVALRASNEAGEILKKNFGKAFWIKDKPGKETLTEIDLMAEESMIRIIRQSFPDHSILSEESGHDESPGDYMWVIDPLDGTTNYSINNPFFCTSVSLLFKNEAVLGMTLAPMTGELFHAVRGEGTFLNDRAVRVSREGDISDLLLSFCNGKSKEDKAEMAMIFSRLKTIARDFDRYKAGALELAFVAAGRFGSYLANSQNSWDSSAGALMVREAGGRVTDFSGREWSIDSPDILATNGLIHDRILEILNDIRRSD